MEGFAGLKSSAWVNMVQLGVKMLGFFIALPIALSLVGGLSGLRAATPQGDYWNFWQGGQSGWMYIAFLGPSFIEQNKPMETNIAPTRASPI